MQKHVHVERDVDVCEARPRTNAREDLSIVKCAVLCKCKHVKQSMHAHEL